MFTQYYFIAFYCIAGSDLESSCIFAFFVRFCFICCGCAEPQLFTINFDFQCENKNEMISRTHHLLRRTLWVIMIESLPANPLNSMTDEKRWKIHRTHNTFAYALKTILKTLSPRERNVCGLDVLVLRPVFDARQIVGPRLTRRG